ncbi:DUF2249 domain-containing protein [Cryobacterium sp. Y50]|uniref:DUF2249 domain-containing protein n=1 Tax=Cryobacterium sp. Y50 TaxID=2048286 RepID=UPI001304C946|nr:DUF2249 domain-containing protein [Cryobacterium sp. Y50]
MLDARTIPHAIRHAAVIGALDAVVPGFARNVIEPHDPRPTDAGGTSAEPARHFRRELHRTKPEVLAGALQPRLTLSTIARCPDLRNVATRPQLQIVQTL